MTSNQETIVTTNVASTSITSVMRFLPSPNSVHGKKPERFIVLIFKL